MNLSFKRAEDLRFELTVEQQHEIRKLYRGIADDIEKELNKPLRVPSDAARQQYLRGLQEQINEALADAGKSTNAVIRANALSVAERMVDCNSEWLRSVGLPMTGAYSWVPQDVVTAVATGQIYDGDWSLSGAIWSDVQAQQSDIQRIIAQGIAENKSAFDIGKDLEKYVDPSAAKPWDWSKVYPGVRRQIDYSAQRLARTMVSHAYQQAFVRTTQKNPFVTQYKWEASNSDRVCELCKDRDGKLFDKDDLPLDHPNGMCTFTAEIPDSMDQVADRLADWVNGKDDPELEVWAKDMYGDQLIKPVHNNPAHTIVQGKDLSETWQPRPGQFDFEIEDIINAQGFDGLPRVVSKEEFDRAVQESQFIAQRTYSATDKETLDAYRDQLYNGKWYVDCSTGGAQYGQGMYCAADYNGVLTDGIKTEMEHYKQIGLSRGNLVSFTETMTVDPSAKIITYRELSDNAPDWAKKIGADKFVNAVGSFQDLSENEKAYLVFRSPYADKIPDYNGMTRESTLSWWRSLSSDEKDDVRWKIELADVRSARLVADKAEFEFNKLDDGAKAALMGYDAINVAGHGESGSYTVILNRTKLIIKGS